VARALHVWEFEAEPDGRDVLEAHDRLQDLLLGDDAAALLRLLLDAAQSWAPQATSINLDILGPPRNLQWHPTCSQCNPRPPARPQRALVGV